MRDGSSIRREPLDPWERAVAFAIAEALRLKRERTEPRRSMVADGAKRGGRAA